MSNKFKLIGLGILTGIPLWSAMAQAPVIQVPPAPTQLEATATVGAGTTTAAAPADLSVAVAEVIRLAESGVGDDVVTNYVHNTQAPFNITADHVLYLRDIGLSPEVISTMLSHDTALRAQNPNPPQVPPPPVEAYIPTNTAPLTAPESVVAEAVPTVASTPPVEVSYFYDDLAPYGSWAYLEPYGWCWQPRVVAVNRAWRPYCDSGHWVYSDCGWYWYSDYSWGWAPFHYGRWQLHDRCGWVWLPDRTWGPAWVTWRTSGSYCGWAPLPPHAYYDGHHGWRYNGVSVGVNFSFGLGVNHFTFVGMSSFGDHDLRHHQVPHAQVRNVYKETTVINNYTVNNNTVINNGVPVDRVAAASHREFRRVAVRDVPAEPGKVTSRWRQADRSGSAVYRTQLKSPTQVTEVPVQKLDDRNPVIKHPVVSPTRTGQRSTQRQTVSSTTGAGSSTAAPTTSGWSRSRNADSQRSTVSTAPADPGTQTTPGRSRNRSVEGSIAPTAPADSPTPTTPGWSRSRGTDSPRSNPNGKPSASTVEPSTTTVTKQPATKGRQTPKKSPELPTYQQPRNSSRTGSSGATPAAPYSPPARSVDPQPKPSAAPTPEYQRSWERRPPSASASTESFDGKTTTRTYPPVQSPSASGTWNRPSTSRSQAENAPQPRGQAVGNPRVYSPKSSPQSSGGSSPPAQSSSRSQSSRSQSAPPPQSSSRSQSRADSKGNSSDSQGKGHGKQ